MDTGKSRTRAADELGAGYHLASRSVGIGRASYRPEMPEPEVLLSSPLQRDATVCER